MTRAKYLTWKGHLQVMQLHYLPQGQDKTKKKYFIILDKIPRVREILVFEVSKQPSWHKCSYQALKVLCRTQGALSLTKVGAIWWKGSQKPLLVPKGPWVPIYSSTLKELKGRVWSTLIFYPLNQYIVSKILHVWAGVPIPMYIK